MKTTFRTISILFTAAVLFAVSSGCSLFNDPVPVESPSDLTVEELLARREAATDPSGAYKNARTFYMRQVVTRPSEGIFDSETKTVIETRFQKPEIFKMTSFAGNQPVSEVIFNGSEAVRVDLKAMTVTRITGDELDILRTSFVFGAPGSDLRSVFRDIRIVMVTIDNVDYYKLICVPALSDRVPVFEVLVDSRDFLTSSFKAIGTTGDDRSFVYEGTIDNYSNYDDVMIPDHCTMRSGRDKWNTQVVRFLLGVPFDAKTFEFPQVAEE